jgi:hypothetical protein
MHRRPEGAYGWISDVTAQVTPTFGAVGSYTLLGRPVPEARRVAEFVRNNYPVPERRRKERPLWRLDYEQVQTLLWLEEPVETFRPLASTWTAPAEFTTRYELGGNPVLQHQAMAVRVRKLLGLSPSLADGPWKEYFLARMRKDGTFNTTPASDGSPGHLMNTLWGWLAAEAVGAELETPSGLAAWVRSCQLPSGGFTYAPGAQLGAVDDLAYTWCALQMLARLKTQPNDSAACARWIEALQTPEGGFQDRPGGEPNPLATFYALHSLQLLGATPRERPTKSAPKARVHPIPQGAEVFTIQVEAPGNGSPQEAVLLAKELGIHLWTAKNSPAGWIAKAQAIADAERVQVQFHIGDEEYGTYVNVDGLGCYSHLVDMVAPYGRDSGAQLPKKNHPYPWHEFRDTRLRALRNGGGRLVWQFLENEELTRILLDEAAETGTYAAIASFHFGNENFLHSQPYLHRWYGRIPFVGLQDAHGRESWWWGNQLTGFRTLFAAREPTWQGWLSALEQGHVMTVRRDAVTNWKTHLAGGSPQLRSFVQSRQAAWGWWNDKEPQSRRPLASLVALKPGQPFEVAAPETGIALRLRLWAENNGQALPGEARTELVQLRVDGRPVEARTVESKQDRYLLVNLPDEPGKHVAEATVRALDSGRTAIYRREWVGGG